MLRTGRHPRLVVRARGSGSRPCLRSRRRGRSWRRRGPRSGLPGICISASAGGPIRECSCSGRCSRCYLPASISSSEGNLSAMVKKCEGRGGVWTAEECGEGCGWAGWAIRSCGVQMSGWTFSRAPSWPHRRAHWQRSMVGRPGARDAQSWHRNLLQLHGAEQLARSKAPPAGPDAGRASAASASWSTPNPNCNPVLAVPPPSPSTPARPCEL